MTDDEKQRVLDGYKAALNPTEEMKTLSRKLGDFYDAQFDAAFGKDKALQAAKPTPKLSPDDAARLAADGIGEAFSSARFSEFFKDAQLADGWTQHDALSVWYSLGNLALVVAVWTTYDDRAKATQMIRLCRSFLQKRWGKPEEVFDKMLAIIDETEPSAFASFIRCKDGKDLMLFFARYVSRILGAPIPFSDRSLFEDQQLGIRYLNDVFTDMAVCQFFVDICGWTKDPLKNALR